MTRLRLAPDDISNYLDQLTEGIGARGSSFRDVDRLTLVHNGARPPRFLFQELKWRPEWESQTPGQIYSLEWKLKDLAQIERFTVLLVIVEDNWDLTTKNYRKGSELRLTPNEYREKFHQWWFPNATAGGLG